MVNAVACAGGTADSGATTEAEQESTELTGCYDVTVGEWVVASRPLFSLRRVPVPSERGDSTDYEIPPRIEFAGPRDPPSSSTAIVVPEGAFAIGPQTVHARPITLTPTACDSPPPVSIDEMRPALARPVNLPHPPAPTETPAPSPHSARSG